VTVGDEVEVQVLDVDFSRERISLSLKATQQDPWQEFAGSHEVGQLVYGRVTKLVQFGAFVQVGDGIEGLVHISEMSTHHVESPEQVVTPGEELWVKIIDLDLQRRRISLSIKQAAEGGELAEEYRKHFEVDEHGNWMHGDTDAELEAAWAEYNEPGADGAPDGAEPSTPAADVPATAPPSAGNAAEAVTEPGEPGESAAPDATTPTDDAGVLAESAGDAAVAADDEAADTDDKPADTDDKPADAEPTS
jgi:small subunit ribosomal protein S1